MHKLWALRNPVGIGKERNIANVQMWMRPSGLEFCDMYDLCTGWLYCQWSQRWCLAWGNFCLDTALRERQRNRERFCIRALPLWLESIYIMYNGYTCPGWLPARTTSSLSRPSCACAVTVGPPPLANAAMPWFATIGPCSMGTGLGLDGHVRSLGLLTGRTTSRVAVISARAALAGGGFLDGYPKKKNKVFGDEIGGTENMKEGVTQVLARRFSGFTSGLISYEMRPEVNPAKTSC